MTTNLYVDEETDSDFFDEETMYDDDSSYTDIEVDSMCMNMTWQMAHICTYVVLNCPYRKQLSI